MPDQHRRAFTLAAATCLLPQEARAKPRYQRLFFIARSTNANLLHYAVRLDERGALDIDDPVIAYWVMRAEDGRREGLTWFERHFAYGFSVLGPVSQAGFGLKLSASGARRLDVRRDGKGRYRAHVPIAGRPAALARIFVQVEEGGALPKVRYVDLFGRQNSGGLVRERLVP